MKLNNFGANKQNVAQLWLGYMYYKDETNNPLSLIPRVFIYGHASDHMRNMINNTHRQLGIDKYDDWVMYEIKCALAYMALVNLKDKEFDPALEFAKHCEVITPEHREIPNSTPKKIEWLGSDVKRPEFVNFAIANRISQWGDDLRGFREEMRDVIKVIEYGIYYEFTFVMQMVELGIDEYLAKVKNNERSGPISSDAIR